MTLVKYFAEEPAAFEVPDEAESGTSPRASPALTLEAFLRRPSLYRGYLSASVLRSTADGEVHVTSAATAVREPASWAGPVVSVLGERSWWVASGKAVERIADPSVDHVADPVGALADARHAVMVASHSVPDAEALRAAQGGAADTKSRRCLARLAADTAVVLWRESAFDGYDWGILSSEPLAGKISAAFRATPAAGVRRFVIPLREARGEHRFHFERYDAEMYARYEVR